MPESKLSIWAYESDADVLRMWRGLSSSEREEQDVYWRRAMQRRLDQLNGSGQETASKVHVLEQWRDAVNDHELFQKGVDAGRASITKTQFAVAGAGFAVLMAALDVAVKLWA